MPLEMTICSGEIAVLTGGGAPAGSRRIEETARDCNPSLQSTMMRELRITLGVAFARISLTLCISSKGPFDGPKKGNPTMKSMIQILGRLTLLSVMLFATAALAQPVVKESTTTTTTTTSGIISEFGPRTIVVKTTTSSNPITYEYTKTTTYVDETGKPVSIETVKTGLPVTIYYDKTGNKMVATKVVVTKSVLADPPR